MPVDCFWACSTAASEHRDERCYAAQLGRHFMQEGAHRRRFRHDACRQSRSSACASRVAHVHPSSACTTRGAVHFEQRSSVRDQPTMSEFEATRSHHRRAGGRRLDSRRHDDLDRRLSQFQPSDADRSRHHPQRREEPHGRRRGLRRPRDRSPDRGRLRQDRDRADDFRREPGADRAVVPLFRPARRARGGRARRAHVLPGPARRGRADAVAAVARRHRHRLCQAQSRG